MGGAKWLKEQKGASLDIDELAPKPEPFNAAQSTTLAIVAILVLLVVVPGLPGIKGTLPKMLTNMLSNVGSISFVLSIILMLTGYGDSKAAVKVMPWSVIMMVCGVSVLIDVMDKSGGLNFLVQIMSSVAGPTTICFWAAFVPAVRNHADVPADDSWFGRIDRWRCYLHHLCYQRRFPPGRYFSAFHSRRFVHRSCT